MRQERPDADLCLGLVPEDLDPAVLAERRVVEGLGAHHLCLGSTHPVSYQDVLDHVDDGEGHQGQDGQAERDDGQPVRSAPQSWSPPSVLRRRGSSQSRRWSPSRLTASTVTEMASPGKAVSHQAVLR